MQQYAVTMGTQKVAKMACQLPSQATGQLTIE